MWYVVLYFKTALQPTAYLLCFPCYYTRTTYLLIMICLQIGSRGRGIAAFYFITVMIGMYSLQHWSLQQVGDARKRKRTFDDAKNNKTMKEMIGKNLTLSIKQQRKFFTVQNHVLDWICNDTEQQHLLYATAGGSNPFFAWNFNNNFAYRHIYKNGGTTVQAQVNKDRVTASETGNRTIIATVRDPISHFLSGKYASISIVPHIQL